MKLSRAGARAVDLGGPSVYQGGGASLKLSTKAAVFEIEILLKRGAKHVDWGDQAPPGFPLAPGMKLSNTI